MHRMLVQWHRYASGARNGVRCGSIAMDYSIVPFSILGISLLVAIFVAMEIGRWSGSRISQQGPERATGIVDGAVFGLMGLLIAFSFSGAASRFDARRQLIVQESNRIETAYLRINLLPADFQPLLRQKFRDYVDARLAAHRKHPDLNLTAVELRQVEALQREIWANAVAGCQKTSSPAVMTLVLGAVNEMIDMATTRTEGTRIHPPAVVPVMLIVLVFACSLLAGSLMAANKTRNWVHVLSFAIMLSFTVLVILDLEYPRVGLIRIDIWDRVLLELRARMG
jgi:hypothetical protein